MVGSLCMGHHCLTSELSMTHHHFFGGSSHHGPAVPYCPLWLFITTHHHHHHVFALLGPTTTNNQRPPAVSLSLSSIARYDLLRLDLRSIDRYDLRLTTYDLRPMTSQLCFTGTHPPPAVSHSVQYLSQEPASQPASQHLLLYQNIH